MEGQGAIAQRVQTSNEVNTPNLNYVSIFRNDSDGLYYGKLSNGVIELIGGNSVSGNMSLHIVTYAALTTLIIANGLIKGDFYLISDYATTYNMPNTAVVNTGPIEQLILQASSVNSLNERAISVSFPQDIISYEVVDSTTQGGTTGRIKYRKDTIKNNSTYYDWRVVKFRRWESAPASGQFRIITDNGGAHQDFFTFNNDSGAANCFNNELGPVGNQNPNGLTNSLNNTVINAICENNTFDINCINNTFIGQVVPGFPVPISENTVGKSFFGNSIGFPLIVPAVTFYKNKIGYGFANNIIKSMSFNDIGYDFSGNIIGLAFNSNITSSSFNNSTIGDNCQYNTFGDNVGNGGANIIGNNFQNNFIGDGFISNTIGNNFSNNKIGNNFDSNPSIGDNFTSNVIGDIFESNTIGTNFANNIIANNFTSNTITTGFLENSIGYNFTNNTIGDGFESNKIGVGFSSNANIGNNFKRNQIGDGFSNNTTGVDFADNVIRNRFSRNTIGDTYQQNNIGNDFQSNVIGTTFLYNIIGETAQGNTIGNGMQRNYIQKDFANNTIGLSFLQNNIKDSFANNTIVANFQNNTICNNVPGTDFSLATLVYASYDKEIFQRSDNTFQLKYTNNANAIIYAAIAA